MGDQFRIHYDPSHAILMGQDTRSLFQYLKDEGYNFLIGGFHVKGQVSNPKGIAEWGYGGQTCDRGDRKNGKPDPDVRKQVDRELLETTSVEGIRPTGAGGPTGLRSPAGTTAVQGA